MCFMSMRNSSWSLNRFKASLRRRARSWLLSTRRSNSFPERRLRLDQWGVAIILQQRQQIAVLASEKVLPQKVAGRRAAGPEEGMFSYR